MPESRHNITVTQLEFGNGEQTGLHSHDDHQLSYAKTGVLTVTVNTAQWVVPPLRAVWIPAGIDHNLTAHGPTTIWPIHINPTFGPTHLDDIAVVGVSPLLRALVGELLEPGARSHDARHHLEALIVLQLDRLAVRPLHLPTLHEPRLAAIQSALTTDPSDRRTLSQWGQYCGASERTLTRLFTTHAGTTFSHWRTQLRLQHSLTLLANETPVTVTAHQCGYHSTSAFIDAFRAVLGTTPGKFFRLTSTGPA